MIGLSPGYLHSSFKLLEMISKRELELSSLANALPRIVILPAVDVVNFVLGIGWVGSDADGKAVMSETGARIHELSSTSERFRQSILDFVGSVNPAWAQLVPKGRQETLAVLSPEIWQCFAEAELTAEYSDEVIRWWDALSARAQGRRSEILMQTGRHGERLSFRYEKERTGRTPIWQSVESNLAGYDILSVVGAHDARKLQIEVKATQSNIEYGVFHVTRYEWETGLLADEYAFHLWILKEDKASLAVLNKTEMEPHIPLDCGGGSWESVAIPFPVFQSCFRSVQVKENIP